ncbi:DUF4169 family protein [Allorhizobium taibaishanense]|uniref:DUF4169 domain-containing protein n=1 Tax=Allorhizobium taibaishanense TaxID=887144 RepID=A0A1Q9A3C0_9HYPH|nr:DUF4169 family protein [Allorhizobium taibaishanense]MBB4006102.1 hypothetical protein [Allorhizobium taibaishanense]OLP49105.1 hypothetical protein BJF91_18600 [Allorhizobium taibaishanense]
MSADVVNLRQFKKAKARADKEKQADQNRLTFGRTKAEKKLTSALNDKARAALDQSKLEGKPAAEEREADGQDS